MSKELDTKFLARLRGSLDAEEETFIDLEGTIT